MSELPTPEFKNDHDVLVAMYVEVKQLKVDVKELKDNTNGRVIELEREKADKDDLEDLKRQLEAALTQIATLQRYLWLGLGFLAAIQVYLQFFRS